MDKLKFNEKIPRSLAKVISWRIVITVSNVLVTFAITGNWLDGFKVAGLMTVVNTVIYTLHERGWNRIQWGKNIIE